MKQKVFFLLMLIGMTVAAQAQTVTVADVEALPGETVTAVLHFEASADSYTGTQFALQFPATGFSMAESGAVSGWNGSIEYGTMTAGKVKFAAAASKAFETASIMVEFTVDEAAALGDYDVTVTDIVFEGVDRKDAIADVTFNVKVVDVHSVLLDELTTTAPSAAYSVNVRVKRTINADEWSTICLPFSMTAEQVVEAFGDDAQLAEFKGWESTEFDNDDNTTGITVTFGDVSTIKANTPYIIKVSSPVSEFTVDGVDIDPDEEPMVSVGKMNRGTFGSFTGSYVPMLIDEECLFLSGNKFWYSTGKTNMKGYRAYFYFQDVLAEYNGTASARVLISFNNESTGISEIETMKIEENERYYNLKGQRVATPKKGLFIKDGRKVVLR